jgi:hypothetical protein
MAFDHDWPEKARVLALLQARGLAGVNTAELSDPAVGGHEGPRRVRQLRAEGHPVQRQRIHGTGLWRYWLGPAPPNAQLELWSDED